MNKVINGKRYDTDKAKLVGSTDNGRAWMDLDYYAESLYKKRTGAFFLHLAGGARSPIAESRDGGSIGAERIRPVELEEARKWAEDHIDADGYAALFGDPGEGESSSLYLKAISASAKAKLEREAAKSGRTQAQVVESLLETL